MVSSVCPDAPGIPALSLLESVCYEQISFWVGVVAKNGGRSGRVVDGTPWTRLTASDFVRLLGDRYPMLALTERQVRYALNRLVDLGLVLRERWWQSECFRSHSWWALCRRVDAVCPDAPGIDAVGMGIVGPHCSLGDSQRGTQMGIRARIRALASCFCPDAVVPVSPSGVIVRGRLLRVDDGACAPLR